MPKSITEIVAQKPYTAQSAGTPLGLSPHSSLAELQTYMTGQRLTDALNFLESRGIIGETALFILSQANLACILWRSLGESEA